MFSRRMCLLPLLVVAATTSALVPLTASATPTAAPPQAMRPTLPSPEAPSPETPRPNWVIGQSLTTGGAALLDALAAAAEHGLNPLDYGTASIRAALNRGDMATAQDLLDKAFLRYAGDLVGGRGYAPSTPHTLLGAVAWSPAPQDFLAALAPVHDDYRRLKDALAALHAVVAAGGWPQVPEGPSLKDGATGPAVATVRQRLGLPPGETFDTTVHEAVQGFQARHGLTADGVIGPATRAALNVPAEARARQVALNLERLRRTPPLPDTAGLRVEVNLAAFELAVHQDGETVMRMKVAVGKPENATPEMRHAISAVIFNPHWYVPRSITENELLPREAANPGVLEREGFEIMAEGDPPRLRQKPGPQNALGRVKFSFPNSDSIYLHDTNAPHVFKASQRAVSHGCVRVEQPVDLATLLIAATGTAAPETVAETVAERIEDGQPRAVRLRQPVPIDLVYRTAWVDADGTLHLRHDIYGLDDALAETLARPRPPLAEAPVVALD